MLKAAVEAYLNRHELTDHSSQEDICLRYLKWWCLEGRDLPSKAAHARVPWPRFEDLPEVEDLDRLCSQL